ncbi:MAG: hypothetical protein H6702_22650 [Myxococcales bacterium]|nr:hypothetical protein [Myxococcales bacterium]
MKQTIALFALLGLAACVSEEPAAAPDRPAAGDAATDGTTDGTPGATPDATPDTGADPSGRRPDAPEGCYSRHRGWADCHDDGSYFVSCLEQRFHELPYCRSQNDGHDGCRTDTCDVDCGGFSCVGLATCAGCDGALCGIYDNVFACRDGRWVEVADFGSHEDGFPPPGWPEDASVP